MTTLKENFITNFKLPLEANSIYVKAKPHWLTRIPKSILIKKTFKKSTKK